MISYKLSKMIIEIKMTTYKKIKIIHILFLKPTKSKQKERRVLNITRLNLPLLSVSSNFQQFKKFPDVSVKPKKVLETKFQLIHHFTTLSPNSVLVNRTNMLSFLFTPSYAFTIYQFPYHFHILRLISIIQQNSDPISIKFL